MARGSAGTLLIGVFAGILLALFLQRASVLQNTAAPSSATAGSTAYAAADFSIDQLPDMLRNSLQMVGRAVRGYKSPVGATTSSLLKQTTTTPSSRINLPSGTTTPLKSFSSTHTPNMASQKSFLDAIKERRTVYKLNKKSPISDAQIADIAKQAVLHVPSSFNSQSARLVVLLNAEHDKFWDFVGEVLKPMVPAEQWSSTEGRVAGFKGGYGTILFFEDPEPVQALQKQFPLYAHHFPDWSEHTSAMHQYALWVALEAEGFGANLQHYNPIIDRKAQEEWKVPLDWKLRAQLVFGGKEGDGGVGEKTFKPVEERLFVHGAKE